MARSQKTGEETEGNDGRFQEESRTEKGVLRTDGWNALFIFFAISSGKIEAKMTRFESLISELYLIGSWLVYSYFVLCAHADVMIHVPIFC